MKNILAVSVRERLANAEQNAQRLGQREGLPVALAQEISQRSARGVFRHQIGTALIEPDIDYRQNRRMLEFAQQPRLLEKELLILRSVKIRMHQFKRYRRVVGKNMMPGPIDAPIATAIDIGFQAVIAYLLPYQVFSSVHSCSLSADSE